MSSTQTLSNNFNSLLTEYQKTYNDFINSINNKNNEQVDESLNQNI